MGTALRSSSTSLPPGLLPARMRVLYIATPLRTGGWLAEAFAADRATEVQLDEATGFGNGVARLREEAFDAVLVTHEPGELDALELSEGLRGGGAETPLVILGAQSEQELAALAFEVGADAYVCVHTATTRTLLWIVARAIERRRLLRENRRLALAERQRLHREHDEADRLLAQQRELIHDLELLRTPANDRLLVAPPNDRSADPPAPARSLARLPTPLTEHYRELLRAYVIMGSGNLAPELGALAELLAAADLSALDAMQLHVEALEELVRGLGSRSTRHVMTRADLLALEMAVHLAECYRARYRERRRPGRQLSLPGFDEAPLPLFAP